MHKGFSLNILKEFNLTDALGSVTDLTDHQGDVARQYRYDAFGGLFTGTVGPYNSVGLTGKTYDAKTGLMDYGARWYDPSVGRFTQQDPLTGHLDQPASQHRYAYVGNNPLNLTDPTGMECTDPVADDLVGDIITTWSCTTRNVSSRVLRSDGWYEIGAYVTTNYIRGRLPYPDGTWFDNTISDPGGSTPFDEWVAPPPADGGGDDGGGDDGGGGGDDDDDDSPPPPDPRIEQERNREYAETVMTDASGPAPESTAGYGYDPYGGYDTTATEGLAYVPQEKTWWDKTKDWYHDVSQTKGFKQTMAALEAVGGVAETAAGVALCTTGAGCVLGAAMVVDGAAHFGSGVLDFGSVTFSDGSSYGNNNVLREAAEWISPEYGSMVYDVSSTALNFAGGYGLARQSMRLLETGESLLGSAEVIAANQSTLAKNPVYRAINAKDAERLSQGLGLEAKNPQGAWTLEEHLTGGSSRPSWSNDPWIATSPDLDIAREFDKAGSGLGVIEVDLDLVQSEIARGWEIYPRTNGVEGLPYHYSMWQQEVSIRGEIPFKAIRGYVE